MPSRWRWPPENSCGYLRMCSGRSPTRSNRAAIRAARAAAFGEAVVGQRLADDLARGLARVERGVGVLEDDLEVTAMAMHLAPAETEELLTLEAHAAGGGLDQPQYDLARGRLAAAGLADQAERLGATDREGDAVDRQHLRADAREHPAAHGEVLLRDPAPRGAAARPRSRAAARAQARMASRIRSEFQQAAQWPGAFSSNGG